MDGFNVHYLKTSKFRTTAKNMGPVLNPNRISESFHFQQTLGTVTIKCQHDKECYTVYICRVHLRATQLATSLQDEPSTYE